MANTYVDYTAVASQTDYNFSFEYLRDDHVKVKVDDVIVTNYTIVTSPVQLIRFDTAPTASAEIRIYRDSRGDFSPLVDFVDGSVLTENELDEAYRHNLFVSQEASEGTGNELLNKKGGANYDAEGNKIINLGTPTASTDAATKSYVDQTIDNAELVGGSPATVSLGVYDVTSTNATLKQLRAWTADIETNASDISTANIDVTASGSTTARSLADRFAKVFNVLDYGATGDGTTDDKASIQAAIDAAETASGGVVFVPYSSAGYLISGSLQMKSKVTLKGESSASNWIGWSTALASGNFIKLADSANTPMVTVGSNVNLWAIHNLKFDGNASNQTSYGAVGIHAVNESIGWQVTHNLIMNTKGYGFLKLGRGVAEILFNSIENGLCMQRCSDVKVIGNNIFSDDTSKTTEFPPFWVGDLSLKNTIEQNMVWHGPSDTDLLRKDISSVSGTTVTFATDHGFFEKMPLTITTSGTLPEPLASLPDPAQTHTYYVNIIDSTSIRLAKSWNDYESSTWINFTTSGSGTHTLRHGLETTFLLSGPADTQHNLISGNRVEDGEQHAGVVKGAIKNVFVGNYFGKSNRQEKSNGSGMQLQSSANNNTFTGNVFGRDALSGTLSRDEYGLFIDSTCFNNSFENNLAESNLTYNINDNANSDYGAKNLYGIREMNSSGTNIPFRYGSSQNVAFELTLDSTISNITASTNTDIAFDSETFDTANACTGGVFTTPEAGRYQFNFSLQLSNVDTASSFIIAFINTSNESYRFYLNANQMVADFDNQTIQGSAIASMDLNDTAKITLFVSGGSNQVDVIGGGGTTNTSFFMGTLLN